jgi:hypothetical protein
MKPIVAHFVDYILSNDYACSHADRETSNIYDREVLVAKKISVGSFDIVFKHTEIFCCMPSFQLQCHGENAAITFI